MDGAARGRGAAQPRGLDDDGARLPPPAGGVAKVAVTAAVVFADAEAEADAILAAMAGDRAGAGRSTCHRPMPVTLRDALRPDGADVPGGDAQRRRLLLGGLAGDELPRDDRRAGGVGDLPHVHALALVLPPPPGPLPDAAFSMGGAIYAGVHAVWDAPEDDAKGVAWLRETADAVGGSHHRALRRRGRPRPAGAARGLLQPGRVGAAGGAAAALRSGGVFDRTGGASVALRAAG